MESRSAETPATASLLTPTGGLPWHRRDLLGPRVVGRCFAEPGRLQGMFTRWFSAPAGEARLELSRNCRLLDLTLQW